jgi:hypothetical protein
VSGHNWSIDAIVHALPSPAMRQQCLRDVHLAPLDELQGVLDRWQAIAVHWIEVEAPKIEEARAHFNKHGEAPPQYEEETEDSRTAHQAWRARMRQAQRDRGAA